MAGTPPTARNGSATSDRPGCRVDTCRPRCSMKSTSPSGQPAPSAVTDPRDQTRAWLRNPTSSSTPASGG